VTARTAVVTIVHGRHQHLLGQLWGLRLQTRCPDRHVVVAMDDPAVEEVLAGAEQGPWRTDVVHVPAPDGRLPLAAARNAGTARAAQSGADVVVLLDVDCIPSPGVVDRYEAVLRSRSDGGRPVVACGDVRYLDAETTAIPVPERSWASLEAGGRGHPARRMGPGVRTVDDVRLFWSLSFATTPGSWEAVGGFDEGYVGYGAEDTDFGQRLAAAGGTMLWLGGATAYHQHHESRTPPVEHVADIVENAGRFARTWGWWPMRDWLDAFVDFGLVDRCADGGYALGGPAHPQGCGRRSGTPPSVAR
jgi:N-acetylglucosaminyl-diphospho-decaprenol L-rhamnosyltransferase